MLTVRGNIKVTGNLNLKTADAISIVTSGLVFYVSAAESTSYPGSGTTWTDISTNSNNGTLTNGPTFDSGDGGSIVFDGTDDYVELGSVDSSNAISLAGSTGQTWEAWFNNDGSGDAYQRIFDKSSGGNGANGHFFSLGPSPTDGRIYCRVAGSTSDSGDGYFTGMHTAGNWTHVCITRKNDTADTGWNFYSNGVLKGSRSTIDLSVPTNTTNARIGTWNHAESREFNGKIAVVRLYNKDLSAAEVLQNYNAEKSRYGL
jgi:hypothetical protein